MLKIGICDDSAVDLTLIKTHISNFFSLNNIQTTVHIYKNGYELLNSHLGIESFDIIFLDINMPKLNGIDIGREIRKYNRHTKIIYITGYLEYLQTAVDAAHCFFYLLKPINYHQLSEKLTTILEYLKTGNKKIELISNKIKWYYSLDDIYYFERIDRKTNVITKTNTLEIYTPIIELAEKLKDCNFASPHRAFLVNMEHIQSITESKLKLTNDAEITLAQRKSADFKLAYNAYLQKCLIQ